MDFRFDKSIATDYRSKSQKIRVMSEQWVAENIYCPACGNPQIVHMKNNCAVADFQCDSCGEIFELKSKNKKIGKKLVDGAYGTMIERITSISNPNLFVMQYTDDLQVLNLSVIPKFFFTPEIIEKRKPLAETARRANWVGCNILYSEIPEQGRIDIISQQQLCEKNEVFDKYKQSLKLQTNSMENRGWLFDVLSCVNDIKYREFTLSDVYRYVNYLESRHTGNHNVEAKIRQQLQLLRDKGFIEFLGKGSYRKVV